MSLPDVDAALERAQADVAGLGARLFELDAERERSAARAGGLRGVSAAAWQAAEDQITVLWAWYQALSQAVGSIAARRRSPGLDPPDIAALGLQLTGPAVDLSAESLVLARRCVPGEAPMASTWAIVPLVGLMSRIVEGAAETITSVLAMPDIAMPKLDQILAALDHSEASARASGVRCPNEAASLRDRLNGLREQLTTDPLAAALDDVAPLAAAAARVSHQVETAIADLAGVGETLDGIDRDLRLGRQDLDRAREALAEVAAKMVGRPDLPTGADLDPLTARAAELGARVEQARCQVDAGDRTGAVRLAEALVPTAAAWRAAAAALAAAAGAPLAHRRELRGRLDAYRAKAHSLGRAEDPRLSQLYAGAEEALYSAPCDLVQAERRLTAYQQGVLGSAARTRPEGSDGDAM